MSRRGLEALAQRVAPRVLDRALNLVDLTDLVRDHVDLDTLVADVDVDAVAARIDLDAILNRVDIDQIASRLDVDAVAARLDLDAILNRVDIDQIAARLDLDAILNRVDIDQIASRLDVDTVAARIDLDAILNRVDIDQIASASISTPWWRASTWSRWPRSSSKASTCLASSRARPGPWPPWRVVRCAGRASAPTSGWSTSSTGCSAAGNANLASRRASRFPGRSSRYQRELSRRPQARTSPAPSLRRAATGWSPDRSLR